MVLRLSAKWLIAWHLTGQNIASRFCDHKCALAQADLFKLLFIRKSEKKNRGQKNIIPFIAFSPVVG